jgi:hypothetical protein
MSGPSRLIEMAWRLVLTLLVCAVVLSFLRQWALDRSPVADGWASGARDPLIGTGPATLCLVLSVIGLAVRLARWSSARRGESARKQRLEAAHTSVGAPERLGARRSVAPGRLRRIRRD